MANGLPWEAALTAVTRAPAEMFGLARELGGLAAGAPADFVLWTGDPFEPLTRPRAVFIGGREIPKVSRQTLLRDRYRTLKGECGRSPSQHRRHGRPLDPHRLPPPVSPRTMVTARRGTPSASARPPPPPRSPRRRRAGRSPPPAVAPPPHHRSHLRLRGRAAGPATSTHDARRPSRSPAAIPPRPRPPPPGRGRGDASGASGADHRLPSCISMASNGRDAGLLVAAVVARHHPLVALQPQHLDRAVHGSISQAQHDAVAGVDAQLARAIDHRGRRGQDLAHPVGRRRRSSRRRAPWACAAAASPVGRAPARSGPAAPAAPSTSHQPADAAALGPAPAPRQLGVQRRPGEHALRRWAGLTTSSPSRISPVRCAGTVCRSSKRAAGSSHSAYDDVDDLAGHHDDFADGLAFQMFGDVGHSQRLLAHLGLGGVARDLQIAAQLAIDLDAQRDDRVAGQRLVVAWATPAGSGSPSRPAAPRPRRPGAGRKGPTSFTSVSRSSRVAPLARASSFTYSIMRRDGGVELHALEVAGHLLDGLVAQRAGAGRRPAPCAASHSSTRRHTRRRKRLSPRWRAGPRAWAARSRP